MLLTAPAAAVKAVLRDPVCSATVIQTPIKDPEPVSALHCTILDDVHAVVSHCVAPAVTALLDPIFNPSTVTVPAPVIGRLQAAILLLCTESKVAAAKRVAD
jgi:hypothetical protein